MRNKYVLVSLPLLVLLLAACTGSAPPLISDSYLSDDSLISGEPCAAPCWNDIVPGETLWVDAVEMLRNDPNVEGLQEQESEEAGDGSSEQENAEPGSGALVAWGQAGTGEYCCQIISESPDGTVTAILLQLAPTMIIDDVLEIYGDPDYAQAFQVSEEEGVLQVVYEDVPMFLWIALDPHGSLLVNSPVVAAIYPTAQDMEMALLTAAQVGPWLGYASFEDYTQAEPVITQSVTLTPVPEGG